MATPSTVKASTGTGTAVANSDKGKGKEAAATSDAPVVGGTAGDWSAVWNQERNAYYFWNRKTGITTWDNPLEAEASEKASGPASLDDDKAEDKSASTSKSPKPHEQQKKEEEAPTSSGTTIRPTSTTIAATNSTPAPDLGGIDPELAYLDPSLAARVGGGASAYVARFNARTGRFEGDPSRNPGRVAEHERAKRQNGHYFDVENWEKTLALQQEQARKRGASELEDGGEEGYAGREAKRQPSKKEMKEIRERNKEKKEKKQKGWLMG